MSGAPSNAVLERLRPVLHSLAHRGPDDSGEFVLAPGDGHAGVVLGHRRLSIIDLTAAGHQPMASRDGRFVVVVNGEIYNYLELRRELEALGHRFATQSDTEVLIAAFAQWGPACLPRLTGMFAFALLDTRERRLFLARDPFGMKPLYYTHGPAGLVFGSTFASVLPWCRGRRADPQAVYDYVDSGLADHGDRTLFEEIRTLPPAHYAQIDLRRPAVTPTCYWRPDLTLELELSFADAAARLRDLFLETVALHLRGDVPSGALLSGGTDSSSVVMAMRHVGGANLDIHTFSYVGDSGAISEEPWIDIVNAAAGTIPHKLALRAEDWERDAESHVRTQEEPFGSIAVYAQNRLYGLAHAAGVRIVLSGQGGDEILAGYSEFWSARVASLLSRRRLREAVRFARGTAAHRVSGDPAPRRTLLRGVALSAPRGVAEVAYQALGRPQRPWTRADWCARHEVRLRPPLWAGTSSRHPLRELLWRYLRERSIPALLRYEDRNSMAWSVEGRLPFLSTKLAEFLLQVPEDYLITADGTRKALFRAAMRGIVPDAILDRRGRVGFSVPMEAWIPRTPGLASMLDAAARMPAIDPRGVAEVRAPDTGAPNPYRLWHLAALAAWANRFDVTLD